MLEIRKQIRLHGILILGTLFWFILLFPGRLGFDYSEAIRLMKVNESTNLWTSTFFNFFKITSLNGHYIFVSSLILLVILGFSLEYLLDTFPLNSKSRNWIKRIIFFSPFYGNFGLTVSHDVTQVSALILLVAVNIRLFSLNAKNLNSYLTIILSAYVLLLNTHTGFIFIGIQSLVLVLKYKSFRRIIEILLAITIIHFITSLGVENKMNNLGYTFIIADIKCVSQHSEARISDKEWTVLKEIAKVETWKEPLSCSNSDEQVRNIDFSNINKISKMDLIRVYLSIVSRNAPVVFMAHVQRATVALPPPFFQPPRNQVSWDIDKPVGYGSNIALQQGPELLHPSIDESTVKINVGVFKYVQDFALIPSFIINQASWFWGWGGLWLWPIFILIMKLFKKNFLISAQVLSPIIVNHSLLFLLAPCSLPRYVYSAVLLGIISTLVLLLNSNLKNSDNAHMSFEF